MVITCIFETGDDYTIETIEILKVKQTDLIVFNHEAKRPQSFNELRAEMVLEGLTLYRCVCSPNEDQLDRHLSEVHQEIAALRQKALVA